MRKQLYISLFAAILALPLLMKAQDTSMDSIGAPDTAVLWWGEEEERSASSRQATSLSEVSSDDIGAPENLLIFGEEEEERSASIHYVDSLSDASSDDDMSSAVDVSRYRDIEVSDSIEATADDSVPEWYIPAVIPNELRAPQRATVSACLTDSILTFNIDSVLTEATTYDYDAAGRTIRTTVWQYAADGTRTGKSKQEYAFDASGTQIYTGTFAWDTNTNDWRGTAKSEFVYNEAHKMESNITYTWVNNTWLPSQALTYAYDAAGRETEFTTYARNASLNRLVPSKQRLQTWYNASKKTQEINYTAYANGAWSAGTRKDYQYDAKGNQIEYSYYASYSGGNWVGSTHELWTYNAANKKTYYEKQTWSNGTWVNSSKEIWEFNSANKQTLHEKYTGSGTTWTITLREISGYDDAGNNTLVENYSYTNGVAKGSKKEEYTFNAAKKKINTYKYKWSNNDWVYNTWAVSDYDAAGNAIETANYSWTNNAWKGTGTRTLKTYNSSKKVTEQITQTWPSGATDWVNATRQTTTYSGSNTTQEASYTWQNDAWVGTTRSDWHYNSAGQNDTIKTYTNNGSDWIYSNRTVNTYDSRGNNILTHNAQWDGTRWVMTSMSRWDIVYDAANHQTLSANYSCSSDSIWIGSNKTEYLYGENGLVNETNQYKWSNEGWICNVRVIKDYDSHNRQILEERRSYVDNSWIGVYKNVSSYDEVGHQTLSEKYSWLDNHWCGTYKYTYLYDSRGNKLEDWTYSWQDTIWIPALSHVFAYDDANRKIEDVVSRYNAATGFAPETKYEYAYGINNLLIISNEYGWADTYWIVRSRNEKYYDSSDNKLRRELIAIYRGGVNQSYADNHYFYSCDAPADNNGAQPRTPTELEEIDENNGNYENDDTNVQPFDPMLPTYNLQGQSVDPATYHGIVIQNGKKYVL